MPAQREFRVSTSSAPAGVAAPMAASLRNGERIVVTGMGGQCLTRALKAAWLCRRQLRLLSRDVVLAPCFRHPGELVGTASLDRSKSKHHPCEIALNVRSDPLVETLSPSYLTPEPSSAGNSVCFFSDSFCASSSWGPSRRRRGRPTLD